jgi:lipoate-protein ligase B
MYVIIGSHVVPLESKFLLIALVIVRITLNVIRHQMSINVYGALSGFRYFITCESLHPNRASPIHNLGVLELSPISRI